MSYDAIVVGGGAAGLQAAIQLGRYRRNVLVLDKGEGRSSLCRMYRNVLGYPEGVSGEHLRRVGRDQAERYGVNFVNGTAIEAKKQAGRFKLRVQLPEGEMAMYEGQTVLLATGVSDRFPELPGLKSCLGLTVYVCPDCDGFEVSDKRTLVLGSGDAGAGMALTLLYFTKKLLYINHDLKPIQPRLQEKLSRNGIEIIETPLRSVELDGVEAAGRFRGVTLANGRFVSGERGFTAFGGNVVHSDLGKQLGVERMENLHVITDPRSKMTSVQGVWAAGDLAVHSEQLTIAIGEGQQAAIWMHKWLLAREKERKRNEQAETVHPGKTLLTFP